MISLIVYIDQNPAIFGILLKNSEIDISGLSHTEKLVAIFGSNYTRISHEVEAQQKVTVPYSPNTLIYNFKDLEEIKAFLKKSYFHFKAESKLNSELLRDEMLSKILE